MIWDLCKSYRWYVLTLLFCSVQAAQSQDEYIIRHYTNENGLPANGIKGIQLDKNTGFLWIGTQGGLTRFDGQNFKSFTDKKMAAASRISFIAKNREGNIFLEDDNFSVYQIHQNLPRFTLTDTFLIAPSIIRGGSYPNRTAKELAEVLKHSDRSLFLPHWITFHEESGDSSSFSFIYFGHAYYYSNSADSLFDFPGFDRLLKLNGDLYYSGPDLRLWKFNKGRELLQVNVEGIPIIGANEKERPQWVWEQGMAEPFLLYNDGLWRLVNVNGKLTLESWCRNCYPRNAQITCIQVWEEQGLIFLGSEVNGLYILKAPFLETLKADAITDEGSAEYAQAELEPGIITTATGYTSFPQNNKPQKTAPLFERRTAYRDKQGDYWFFIADTILHYNPKTEQVTRLPAKNGASRMVFAETNNQLYAISDRAIAQVNDSQYLQLYELPYSLNSLKNSLDPTDAIEWRPGVLAIATEKLVLFDVRERKLDTITVPDLTARVRTVFKYNDYLLVGTYGQGFYIFKNGIVKKMPLDKNNYLSFTHCFLPDQAGFCWISSNRGLFKVSLNALVAAFEENLSEIYYQYFGKNDGILNTELNGGCQPCALKLSTGLFSFPSMKGLVVFDPQKKHDPPPTGKIFVDEIWGDTIRLQTDDNSGFRLPFNTRTLRFQIVMSQFGNPENIYFSYKLENYNENWESQDLTKNNIIQFGGLKPGTYTLNLRVRNGFEPGKFGMKIISFQILKPWYQSWLFYLFCFVVFLGLTWLLVGWRTSNINKRRKQLQKLVSIQTHDLEIQSEQLESQLVQLKKQQEVLEEDNMIKARLISIISHDMITPLKFLGEVSKKLRNAFQPSDPSHRLAGSMITISNELESLSVNMLTWIKFHHESNILKPEYFDLHPLINEFSEIARMLAAEKGVHLYSEVPENTFTWQLRQAVGVIIYNLAMNAMKHTATGSIRITSERQNGSIIIYVIDTGSGMTPKLVEQLNSQESFVSGYPGTTAKKHQFGFVIIKDLLRLTGGEMKVESTLGKGTIISIRLRDQAQPLLND